MGKSVLLASVVSHLDVELKSDANWVLQYLSCETLQNSTGSDARNDSSLSISRVQNTLIYGLYDLVNSSAYEGETTILEKCNAVFQNPKQKKATGALMQHQKAEDLLPDLDDALESLAQILEKKLFIVVDAVEMVADLDQEEFVSILRDVLNRSNLQTKFLVSCSRDCKFYDLLEKNETPHVTLSEYNRGDIELTINAKLRNLPGWSDAEKEEAQVAILEKTGSDFKYAVQVAIPFLEEPWQRPLSNRLKELPGGLNETYSQALSQMASNYRALLRTSVTWALLSNGPVTVTEVMDSHVGTYLSAHVKVEDSEPEEESPLHREQIRAAGGPFLDCHKVDKHSIVRLKDAAAVRRFFVRSADESVTEDPEAHICDNCRESFGKGNDFVVSEKDGHLALAITLGRFCLAMDSPNLIQICSQTPQLPFISGEVL